MLRTKYKRVIDIIDEEIDRNYYNFNLWINNKDYENVEDEKIHDEMILQNWKLSDEYLHKLQALCDLKRKIQKELGE